MFIAFRETKCSKNPSNCFLQFRPLLHLRNGPSKISLVPQDGHFKGTFTSITLSELRISKLTFTICGMTSPALLTRTVSLTFMSNLFSSSILWSETFEILAPESITGSI